MDLATRIRDGARRGGDDAKNRGHFQTKGLAWREFRSGCSADSALSLRSAQVVVIASSVSPDSPLARMIHHEKHESEEGGREY